MKKLVFAALVVSSFFPLLAGPLDNAWLKGVTDKRDPLSYKPGEKMTFTVSLENLKGAFLTDAYNLYWKRSADDGKVEEGTVPFTAKPFVYSTSLDQPGFVRLQLYVMEKGTGKRFEKSFTGDTKTPEGREALNRFERGNKYIFFDGGAAVEPEKLVSHPEPTDFDAFWKAQFARLDLVPMQAERRLATLQPNEKVDVYAISVTCAGLMPVTGYLSVPKAVKSGQTFPARFVTRGYDGDKFNQPQEGWAPESEIRLIINAHGLKLPEFGATEADRKALYWAARSNHRSYAFDHEQNADPESAYFNGMVLRVKRALQFLKTVEGWNGRDLIAEGGSQGGLQTIWAAACGEGVSEARSEVTWNCDMFTSGLARRDPALNLARDGWYIPWTEALGYFDAANWARRIPASCLANVTRAGLGDYCCPPTGLAKMFNNIPGPKKIRWVQGSQHGFAPPDYPERDTIIER